MSTNNIKTNTKIKAIPNCPMCQGTGVAKYYDMSLAHKVPPGEHTLEWLCDNYGGIDVCPDCFPEIIMPN